MAESNEKSVAELVFDVSERTSALVREEVELAKAEVSDKVGKLLRGSAVGIAAGVFAFLALILAMEGIAWLLNEVVFDNFWAGFFVESAVFLLIAAGAGYFAYRSVRAGSPPVPEQAIEEAKRIRTTIEGDEGAVTPQSAPTPSVAPSAAASTPPATGAANAPQSKGDATPPPTMGGDR